MSPSPGDKTHAQIHTQTDTKGCFCCCCDSGETKSTHILGPVGLWVQYKQLGGQCTRTVRWGQGYFSQQICHFSEHKWQITWNILSLATEGGKLARTFPNWSEVWTSSAQCNFNLNQCQSSSNMTQTLCEMSRESDDSSSQIPREGEVNSIRNKKRFFILAKIWK